MILLLDDVNTILDDVNTILKCSQCFILIKAINFGSPIQPCFQIYIVIEVIALVGVEVIAQSNFYIKLNVS